MKKIDQLGVPIYDNPVPHIRLVDLKLALEAHEYTDLVWHLDIAEPKKCPVKDAVTVEALERYFLRNRRK